MHFYLIRSIYLHSFLLIPYVVLELCPGQSSKCKNEQRATTPKLGKAELWFRCTTLLLNEIYQPTKCLVDTSCSFIRMSRKRCGRSDVRTYRRADKAATICSPFVDHKNIRFWINAVKIAKLLGHYSCFYIVSVACDQMFVMVNNLSTCSTYFWWRDIRVYTWGKQCHEY